MLFLSCTRVSIIIAHGSQEDGECHATTMQYNDVFVMVYSYPRQAVLTVQHKSIYLSVYNIDTELVSLSLSLSWVRCVLSQVDVC